MIINLTSIIRPKELIRISVVNNSTESPAEIVFTFSKDALVGFATELLWLYDDISDSRVINITTHPLSVDPSPNQAVGFYLTSTSPTFSIKTNTISTSYSDVVHIEGMKDVYIKNKTHKVFYVVNTEIESGCPDVVVESYELSKRNILDIVVKNEDGVDITSKCGAVLLEINKEGIKDFATSLLIWANNDFKTEYVMAQEGHNGKGTNIGVILSRDSIPTKLCLKELGNVNDYDSRIE